MRHRPFFVESQGVTCYLTQLNALPPITRARQTGRLVDLLTQEGQKAELTWVAVMDGVERNTKFENNQCVFFGFSSFAV